MKVLVTFLLIILNSCSSENHYTVLNIPRSATNEEIKSSYRQLARQYHPDKNRGDEAAKEKFIRVSEAHETLSDPEKRRDYDYEMRDNSRHQNMHHPRQSQRGRGHGGHRRYVFTQNGRSFVFTEDDLYGTPGQQNFPRQPSGQQGRGSGGSLSSVLFTLLQMGGFFAIVRWLTQSPTEGERRAPPPKENTHTDAPASGGGGGGGGSPHPSPSDAAAAVRRHPVDLAGQVPHLSPYAKGWLKRRGGYRLVLCFPQSKETEAWTVFEQVAAKFARDKLCFLYLDPDVKEAEQWAAFTRKEFSASEARTVMVVLAGGGTKGTVLKDDGRSDEIEADEERAMTRWIERLLDGQEPLRTFDNDLPSY